ncbi:hypothetical protein Z517_00473 [Fonsecaea pedrosoi CBS 271.37]|uniref:Manganese lipoxygenase n=1 Tax=Fonsecaea pedrosoi CBS 271.37 TaxID=1442368 RepID=A0A0D2H2M4_9EURO|nr:uncharacterized protein Z517_00473 [Fonsecaea pedrosoi CBS 271.37]KIW85085.1 hypothetical protein Z517_00473 [Fonsecaea pedrosoi CBS 271.37]
MDQSQVQPQLRLDSSNTNVSPPESVASINSQVGLSASAPGAPPARPSRSCLSITRARTERQQGYRRPITCTPDAFKDLVHRSLQGIQQFIQSLSCIPKKNTQSANTLSASTMGTAQVPVKSVTAIPLKQGWDEGAFTSELLNKSIVPRAISAADTDKKITPPKDVGKPPPIQAGTYQGTKLALTQMMKRIETRFESFFDVAGFETSVPLALAVDPKSLYTFQKPGSDNYPPHLDVIPKVDQVNLLKIFDFMRLLDTGTLVGTLLPDTILDFIHDHPEGFTVDSIEARNNELHKNKEDIFDEENIGNRPDWWTDAVFAQQQFVGTNPTTIEQASSEWLKAFTDAAQSDTEIQNLLSTGNPKSFYVQDCSYFRTAIGADQQADMISNDGMRRLCASVTLFQLTDAGALHPLAIAVDYKGSLANSVVIFNKRSSPSSPESKDDWPWRYAKTCAQTSDWLRHEVTVHLINTHLVEEVTIVAAHRAFSTDHPVYRLLQPHWLKTLSVNAAARATLVPNIIVKIVGITDPQLYSFLRDGYKRFDWTAKYVPNDLASRGFPPEELASNPKFHNYAYARNMILMWQTLRKFVSSVLAIDIHSDEQVEKDEQIASWIKEMQDDNGGQMKSFPEIKTFEDLVDAVTMCIHIASPQHTAINYLQSYYQSFVISKPSALFSPLPKSLDDLKTYEEEDLLAAYPIKHAREWLLASHVPYLLSYRVAEEQNMLNFALSTAKLASLNNQTQLAAAAAQLYADLMQLAEVFKINSKDMDDKTKSYDVMDPSATAVSILL